MRKWISDWILYEGMFKKILLSLDLEVQTLFADLCKNDIGYLN